MACPVCDVWSDEAWVNGKPRRHPHACCEHHITHALLFTESLCSVCGRRLLTPITKERS